MKKYRGKYKENTNYKDDGAGAKRKKKSFLLCIGERNHFHTGPINIGILWFSQSPNGFHIVLQEMVLSASPVAAGFGLAHCVVFLTVLRIRIRIRIRIHRIHVFLGLLDPDPDPDPFSQRYGSAFPDPHQNVMDPQHWFLDMVLCDSFSVVCRNGGSAQR
jgi:hypothetical protein